MLKFCSRWVGTGVAISSLIAGSYVFSQDTQSITKFVFQPLAATVASKSFLSPLRVYASQAGSTSLRGQYSSRIADAVERTESSLVGITSQSAEQQPVHSSGVLIDPSGWILAGLEALSAVHGNENTPDQVQVRLSDGRSFSGTVVSSDPMMSMTVIKIEAPSPLPHIALSASKSCMSPGESVMALGWHPYLGINVSVGTLSAIIQGSIKPTKQDKSTEEEVLNFKWLESDVITTPYHTGGPLINTSGDLIGLCNRRNDGNTRQLAIDSITLAFIWERFQKRLQTLQKEPL